MLSHNAKLEQPVLLLKCISTELVIFCLTASFNLFFVCFVIHSLVHFTNANLKHGRKKKHKRKIKFACYQWADQADARKKQRRTLVCSENVFIFSISFVAAHLSADVFMFRSFVS